MDARACQFFVTATVNCNNSQGNPPRHSPDTDDNPENRPAQPPGKYGTRS